MNWEELGELLSEFEHRISFLENSDNTKKLEYLEEFCLGEIAKIHLALGIMDDKINEVKQMDRESKWNKPKEELKIE